LQREPKLAHAQEKHGTFGSQLDPFRGALDQRHLQGLLEASQAFAECGLAQTEHVCRASEMPMLRDDREVFNVAQFHVDNRNS
jgi:hypothetical protein